MNGPIEPLQVELADIIVWQRESWALLRRRPIGFLLLSLLYFAGEHQLQADSWLTFSVGLLACHAVLAVVIVHASGVDHSRAFSLIACYRGLRNAIFTVGVFSAVYALIWFIAALLASMVTIDVPHNDYTDSAGFALLEWLSTGTMNLFVLYCCVMVSGLWFLLPLAVFHGLGLVETVRLAKFAEQKNFLVILTASYVPFGIFFVLFLISEVALAVAFAAMPLYGIYLYVAYRHVFLGKRENEPARLQATVVEPSASA